MIYSSLVRRLAEILSLTFIVMTELATLGEFPFQYQDIMMDQLSGAIMIEMVMLIY